MEEINLSANFLEKARSELGESDQIRSESLSELRDWIKTKSNIRECRQGNKNFTDSDYFLTAHFLEDDKFLLRFLRIKKFNIEEASKILSNFLMSTKRFPYYYENLDIEHPILKKLLESGYMLALPERDAEGCRIVLLRPAAIDVKNFTLLHIVRFHMLLYEMLLNEEETQISGIRYILDFSDLPKNFLSLFSLPNLKTLINIAQHSLPARRKSFYFVNLPSFANTIIHLLIGFLNEKLRNRIEFFDSIDELKEVLDLSLIPQEYGGKLRMADIKETMRKELVSHRQAIMSAVKCEIEIQYNQLWTISSCEGIEIGAFGSFKTISVD
jgi:hypothetical protein